MPIIKAPPKQEWVPEWLQPDIETAALDLVNPFMAPAALAKLLPADKASSLFLRSMENAFGQPFNRALNKLKDISFTYRPKGFTRADVPVGDPQRLGGFYRPDVRELRVRGGLDRSFTEQANTYLHEGLHALLRDKGIVDEAGFPRPYAKDIINQLDSSVFVGEPSNYSLLRALVNAARANPKFKGKFPSAPASSPNFYEDAPHAAVEAAGRNIFRRRTGYNPFNPSPTVGGKVDPFGALNPNAESYMLNQIDPELLLMLNQQHPMLDKNLLKWFGE